MKRPDDHDPARERVAWAPCCDLFEDGDKIVVTCDIPGVTRHEIDIRFHNGLLTISGERNVAGKKGFQRRERPRGTFGRSFAIPGLFDTERLNASLRHGVLTITLPKKTDRESRPVKVPVE